MIEHQLSIFETVANFAWIGTWEIIILLGMFLFLVAFIAAIVIVIIASSRAGKHRNESAILRCSCGYDLKAAIKEGKTVCPKCGKSAVD